MGFISQGFSRVLAAFGAGDRPELRAADTPTGDRQHSWRAGVGGVADQAGPELAQALGQPEQSVIHRGTLELIGQLPRESRGYSGHAGDNALKPVPPMYDPRITQAILSVTNADDGTGNLMGEQGFAVHVKQGIARFDGAIWGGNWVQINGVGKVEDARKDELGAGVDDYYYYADGLICGDSKGRDLTDVPVRLFYTQESSVPPVGEVVFEGMRDTNGLAWGSPYGAPAGRAGHGKITTGWDWVTSFENAVGRLTFNPCDDSYGNGVDTTRTYSALVPAGSNSDPNGQVDVVFGWSWDRSGSRIAVTGNVFDQKIGSVKPWLGELGAIPKGWVLVTEATEGAGKYLIGYKAGGDYDPAGTLRGSHPITPISHDYTDDPEWQLADHEWQTVAATADITISTSPVLTSDLKGASLVVAAKAAFDTAKTGADLSISDHVSTHAHHAVSVGQAMDYVGGMSAGGATPQTGQTELAACPGTSDTHQHDISLGYGEYWTADGWPDADQTWTAESSETLVHAITGQTHLHVVPQHDHAVTGQTHFHTIPEHDHDAVDPGHQHDNPHLIHTGRLLHHSQDFRSPGVSIMLLKRVGPDDD